MWYELLTEGVLWVSGFSLLVTLPAYLLVLAIIYKHRNVEPFNSEFFVVYLALGVVDIVCYFIYLMRKLFFLGFIPSVFEPVNQPNLLSTIVSYPIWMFGFLQYFLIFVLTLNRFTSIVHPRFYSTYWRRGRSKWLILFCTVFCCILTFPILFSDCQFGEYNAEIEGVNWTFYNAPMCTSRGVLKYFSVVWSISIYGLTFSCAIFYLIMLKTLQKTPAITNRRKLEMQMFWVGFMMLVLNLLFVFYIILRNTTLFDSLKQPHLHEWILMFISDIYDLPNGVILLLTSTNIRNIIIRGVKRKFNKQATNSNSAPQHTPPPAASICI